MTIDMTVPSSETFLVLQNWFSPAFPIGAFSYSSGMETAIARGDVSGRDDVSDWLMTMLCHGTAFTDAVCLHAVLDGSKDDDQDVNDLCLALCAGAERYQETIELGSSFSRVLRETETVDLPSGIAYPVAIGMAARHLGLDAVATLAAFLQSVCMNQISVAVRAVPMGQVDGQSCLKELLPTIRQVVTKVMATKLEDIGSFALASDLCSLEHETATQRIYRT